VKDYSPGLVLSTVRRAAIHRSVIVTAILFLACRAWADPVTVHVVDPDGNSISGVTVTKLVGGAFLKSQFLMETTPLVVGVTDARGAIQLDCNPSDRSAFLVAAPGKPPRAFGFWGCVPPTYSLVLPRAGTTYSGRIVNADGKPAANAPMRIRVLDYELLAPVRVFSPDYPQISYDLHAHTDSEGRFNLPAPQEGSVQNVDIQRADGWHATMQSDGDEGAATRALNDGTYIGLASPLAIAASMQPATRPSPAPTLSIHLRVFDASTNRPIENIRIIPGGCRSPDQLFRTLWRYKLAMPGNEATWDFFDNSWAYFLRVEADGYAPAPTRIVKASEKSADVELRLIKATPLSIAVRTQSGHPAAGARAYLSTPTIDLNVPTLDPQPDDAQPLAVAGDDGVLHFVPPNEPYRLAIEHREGSAEVSCTDLHEKPVILDPWASADIQLGSARHPLVRAFIEPQSGISQIMHCRIDWMGFYYSDATGHLQIPTLRPGEFYTAVILPSATAAVAGWNYLQVPRELKPGEHADLPVMTGATTLKASLPEFPGYKWSMLWINPAGPAVDLPPNVNRLTSKAQNDAVEKAEKAAPDSHAQEDVVGQIYLRIPDTGRVSVAGLRPGTYVLGGYVESPPGNQAAYTLKWYFSVPSSAPPVVDLGTVSPIPADPSALRIGQITPDLLDTTLDGKPFSLKSLRGKWVLLDFWGTWCGFCIREEPTLKDAYEGWSRDNRLTMVSASVDDTVDQVRRHVAENALPWIQLVLGPRDQTKVPQRFSVDGYPTIMLISPRGELIETDLRGSALRDALMKFLGPPAPPDAKQH
jgi:thiol-disulfide isomerase/thioredoxin